MLNSPQTFLLFCFLLSTSGLFSQRPTVDRYGNPVERLSKSPVEWKEKKSTYGERVALETIAPILDGEQTKNEEAEMILEAFNPSWNNILLVTDYTGSMYDFAPVVLRLHLMNQDTQIVKHLVLFNDGDGKSSSSKKIGQTGGIYFVDNPSDTDQLLEGVADVINNGAGGDVEENDLEAVIAGITRYEKAAGGKADFEKVVLIADGDAPVRDMDLLPNLKYSLEIVLCRGKRSIDDYLEIAYQTKGTLFSEGQEVVFGKENQQIIATHGSRVYKRIKAKDWR